MSTQPTFTEDEWKILRDPTASYWLKEAIRNLNARDPLDAWKDAVELAHVAKSRLTSTYFAAREGLN
jgi:hypothetical protein